MKYIVQNQHILAKSQFYWPKRKAAGNPAAFLHYSPREKDSCL